MTPVVTHCLRRFHESPEAGHRLVLCPHAGGNASWFVSLAAALSGDLDVSVVQYPGRLDRFRDPFAESIPELAAEVFSAVDWDDPRPVSLFGHSMGAIVAFEVVRLAEARGCHVPHLFVSASPAPSGGDRDPTGLRPNRTFESVLAEGAQLPESVLADREACEFLLAPLRADCRAADSYGGAGDATVRARVTALGGVEDEGVPVSQLAVWGCHAPRGLVVQTFPGDHFYLQGAESAVAQLIRHRLFDDSSSL